MALVADYLMTASSAVQLTLTGTLAGMGLGQFVVGAAVAPLVGVLGNAALATGISVVQNVVGRGLARGRLGLCRRRPKSRSR